MIHGDARGPHQDDVNLSIAKWAVGPYHRELDLSESVDGAVTNATYGNGVLVLPMPKLRAGQAATAVEFRLVTVANAHGERVGHIGRTAIPHTTAQHRTEKHQGRQTRA